MNKATKFAMMLCAAALGTAAHAAPLVLPDSCGKDEVKFDVKDEKDKPAPTAPEEGKALIVFIAKVDRGNGYPQVRLGIDGAWVGATRDNSYFTVSVAPGEHHLCAHKEAQAFIKLEPAMETLTAEAGKVYYYEFRIIGTRSGGGGGGFVQGQNSPFAPAGTPPPPPTYVPGSVGAVIHSSYFGAVSEDEGKYRVKISPLAVSTPKAKE